ncbi:MAG: serine/threonine-protein kinase [Thermoanaerobaculaceae bacterium]|nr:serine/threonine-protein kinase [Thermoanaerobaculaceae bacterium]
MALETGARLGGYSVTGLLGTGGMGEVYRARDERLGRDVAIKVIAQALASETKELLRFEREARALAALSHPNILGIFDFGEHDGVHFAVMELLDGSTLRERLNGGALPWRTAVAIASAAARGVAAAHARGIVHRDLKPENIFLLADGGVKVLDFGLARRDPAPGAPVQPEEETLIGTAVYMAPEQILRKPADARTDVFALGVVLFEMLAGRGPFTRSTVGETIGAVLTEDPPALTPTGGAAPPALERIVRRCLAKDPEERLQSAYDLVFALGELTALPPGPARTSAWPLRVAIFLAGALVGAGAAALFLLSR